MAHVRPSGLIIPRNVASVRANVYFCTVCSAERLEAGEEPVGFTADEAGKYQRHVVDCAAKHEEQLRAMSLRETAPGIFGNEGWDTELEQWVRDNRDALKEGRLKL